MPFWPQWWMWLRRIQYLELSEIQAELYSRLQDLSPRLHAYAAKYPQSSPTPAG